MIRLRQALIDCGVSQARLAEILDLDRPHVNKVLTGKLPVSRFFRDDVARWLASGSEEAARVNAWAEAEGGDIWAVYDGPKYVHHARRGEEIRRGTNITVRAIVPGDPQTLKPHTLDRSKRMISVPVRKHFKLVGNPFLNEIRTADDIFLSRDHRFIKSMIIEAASAAGLCAIYGEVGSGKSTMRKAAYRDLTAAGIKVIYPLILDKAKIHAGSLMDAVIMDLSEESPKRSNEAKTRQAYEHLKSRRQAGLNQVLIIEEAHLLTVHAMKYVKQIYEFEDGYTRLCGVVLIGQSELGAKMDETQYPQLRELIRRTAAAEIQGLDAQDVGRYLLHKIARSNGRAAPPEIFADDAFPAIARRLSKTDKRGRVISTAHPLSINNLAARAMARAAEFGEAKVTAEVVHSL